MSLSFPVSTVKKEDYDLLLYSNQPYGYYIKKFDYKTKLLTTLTPCIKDFSEAVDKFNAMVNTEDTLSEILEDLDRCEKYIIESTGKKDLEFAVYVIQNIKSKITKMK